MECEEDTQQRELRFYTVYIVYTLLSGINNSCHNGIQPFLHGSLYHRGIRG